MRLRSDIAPHRQLPLLLGFLHLCFRDSEDPKASNNMVQKGSWILQGSLLSIVLRPPNEHFTPANSLRSSLRSIGSQNEFVLDTTLPCMTQRLDCHLDFLDIEF